MAIVPKTSVRPMTCDRFEQRKREQRITDLDGKTGLLEPVEHRGDVHYCPAAGDQLPQTWS